MKLTSIKNLNVVAIDVKNLNAIKGGASWGSVSSPVGGGSRPSRPTTMSAATW